MQGDHFDVEILGQGFRYPKTVTGAASVLGVLCAGCFIVYSVLNADTTKLEQIRVWSSMFLGAEGQPQETSGTKQIQFWTPSPRTSDNASVPDWETNVTEERIAEFGDVLHNLKNINGYRRYEVFGYGKS